VPDLVAPLFRVVPALANDWVAPHLRHVPDWVAPLFRVVPHLGYSLIVPVTRGKRVTFNSAGDAHELTFSTSNSLPLLGPDPIKLIFLQVLDESRQKFFYDVWAYVLMPEHVHLLINPREPVYDIDRIRQDIKKRSAFRSVAWMREHRHPLLLRLAPQEERRIRTRFWQDGKGYDRNISTAKATWASIEYINMNPVKRGLCQSPADWQWSSARLYEHGEQGAFEVDLCPVPAPT
jgi:putative transposase